MEISVHLYEWLQRKNIYDLQPLSKNSLSVLPVSLSTSFEEGHGLAPLLESMGERVPELKPPQSPQAKLANWNLVSEGLERLGVHSTAQEVEQKLTEVGLKYDKWIDFDEFCQVLEPLPDELSSVSSNVSEFDL